MLGLYWDSRPAHRSMFVSKFSASDRERTGSRPASRRTRDHVSEEQNPL